ncbi:OmpA family protein [Roseomonas sp. OT10]|uniref:OmpA/MotB family protein n=1 Tax=Roseomonas cutis TaxID=2897332 RepID=UPI001E558802|nr:OmpA family protein [Roseomonas sp. OT10]UFN48775.1 OmpA family protein [Roseomonas sp. OT10]
MRRKVTPEEGEQWLSVADLMSGLMIIFLFLAVSYLRPLVDRNADLEEARERVRQIVVAFTEDEGRLADELEQSIGSDLPRWGGELDRARLAVRFRAPDLLFEQGQARLRPEFRRVLEEFLPRYLAVLSRNSTSIEEVRIEGHTSSEWNGATSPTDAFFRNMALSQDRTRSVLEVVLTARALESYRDWARSTVTANGLASARPIARLNAEEDTERSRRVEFRVVTRAREKVLRVLDAVR